MEIGNKEICVQIEKRYQYTSVVYHLLLTLSSNPTHGEAYSVQHYVIKIVSDLWQVDGFLWVLLFPPLIKLTAML